MFFFSLEGHFCRGPNVMRVYQYLNIDIISFLCLSIRIRYCIDILGTLSIDILGTLVVEPNMKLGQTSDFVC